nr:hypothetical protein [Actinomycetota bacterium]
LLLIHEGSGLFDRSDPSCRRYVRAASSTTDPPRFQPHDLANRLRDKNAAKQAPIPSGTIATAKPERDCYGHLVGRFLSHLVLFLLKKYGAFASLSLDGAYAVLIDAVTVSIGRPEAAELRKHHEAQLAFLSA